MKNARRIAYLAPDGSRRFGMYDPRAILDPGRLSVRCSHGVWQPFPPSRESYSYAHSGEEYRALVDAVWRMREASL